MPQTTGLFSVQISSPFAQQDPEPWRFPLSWVSWPCAIWFHRHFSRLFPLWLVSLYPPTFEYRPLPRFGLDPEYLLPKLPFWATQLRLYQDFCPPRFRLKYYVCVLCAHSSPILFETMDCSPLDSSVHVIFQARILEWAAISYSRGTSRPRKFLHLLWFLPWQADSLPLYHLGSPQALDLDFQTVSGWCWLPGLLPQMSHQSGPLPWGITLCYLFLLMHPWDSGTSPNF